jgi:hypothetical protein
MLLGAAAIYEMQHSSTVDIANVSVCERETSYSQLYITCVQSAQRSSS